MRAGTEPAGENAERSLGVLVPDGASDAARGVTAELRRAGHTVHHCVGESSRVVCVAVQGGQCPLDTSPISVAVCAPVTDPANPSLADEGVSCSIRRGIPVVIVGEADGSPFLPYAVSTSTESGVAEAVSAAASEPLRAPTERATTVLRRELDRHGMTEAPASAEVRRKADGGLSVILRTSAAVPPAACRAAAVKVAGAVRALDRWARYVDVQMTPGGLQLHRPGAGDGPERPESKQAQSLGRRRRRR